MPPPAVSKSQWQEAEAAFKRHHGNFSKAARDLGLSNSAFRNRLLRGRALHSADEESKNDIESPALNDPELPIDEILKRADERYKRKLAAKQSREWMRFKVKIDGPFALAFVGDPHLDDNGCNWNLLRRDIDIMKATRGMFAVGMGDYTNNWSGKLQRIYAHQETTRPQAWRMAQWFFSSDKKSGAQIPWMLLLKGNHDCLDEQTEALTKRGWKKYQDIKESDEIFSIDLETRRGVWSPINAMLVKSDPTGAPMEMKRIRTRRVDLFCTPSHRVLHERKKRAGLTYSTADSLPSDISIPIAVASSNDEHAISDDELAIVGWFLTDGCFARHGEDVKYAHFYQSKDPKRITSIIERLGWKYTIGVRTRKPPIINGTQCKSALPETVIRLDAASSRKFIALCPRKMELPEWSHRLSDRQARVLLDAMMAGDGTWYGDYRGGGLLYGREGFLDHVQALCHTHNISASMSADTRGAHRLNISFRTSHKMYPSLRIATEQKTGSVWCLSVPHGNFLIRRSGRPHFTGNCWSDKYGNGDPLEWMERGTAPLEDWQAKFEVASPGGRTFRIWAAHDFPGSSIYNSLHGPMRRAMFTGAVADIFVCGDKHNWALQSTEHDETHAIYWSLRARGYKMIDAHAEHLGYGSQRYGASVVAVIDPDTEGPGAIQCFADIQEAASYLTWKRGL